MSQLRAYSHSKLPKSRFLAELQSHVEADRLIKGEYFRNGGDWRGCAIGCSLESVRRRLNLSTKYNDWYMDHKNYEIYLGIPETLARLEDCIFENLPIDDAKKWPLRFSNAIPQGADLSNVWNKFAPWMLKEIALPGAVKGERAVLALVQRVIDGYESAWQNDDPSDAANDAKTVGNSLHDDTEPTAFVSAGLAYSAFYAAYGTKSARSAANAANTVARLFFEDRRNAWRKMSDRLCELMAEAPQV